MTAKDGFVTGMALGLASWFCLNVLPTFIVFPRIITIFAAYLFALLVFVALALPIASLLRGKRFWERPLAVVYLGSPRFIRYYKL